MNTLKPVRLRHAWQGWSKGHVFTAMPAAQAQHMVAAGQAEYVAGASAASPSADEPAAAAMSSPVDRMMRPARRTAKRLMDSTGGLLGER